MKMYNYAGMTILAGALALAGCSSDVEELGGIVKGDVVKSQFSLSITQKNVKGRMTADATQSDGTFKGMTGIYLFPLSVDGSTATAATLLDGNAIKLADFTAFDHTTDNKKVYTDVQIPLGTKGFLFYGKSQAETNGALTPSWESTTITTTSATDVINFKPVTCYTADAAAADKVLAALNGIATSLTTNFAGDDLTKNFLELRAGSSTSVCAVVEDLYNALKKANKGAEVGAEIEKYFTATGTDVYTLAWKEDPNYPAVSGLPDGAVSVTATDGVFAYTNDVQMDGVNQTALTNFVKPAELYYFVQTAAGVDDATHFGNSPTGTNYTNSNWSDVAGSTDYDFTAGVGSTTQSVVLKDQIQYGVGRLETTVKVSAEGLKDSHDNLVQINAQKGFELTGVLVGDQKQVNWNFEQNTEAASMTLYDGTMPSTLYATTTAATAPNSTLVLESEAQKSVKVAIELVNHGEDFYGVNGQLIPTGTKFYLVGELVINNGTQPDGQTLDKVFIQDYVTKANFTIKNLKNAYNVVPDLRAPKMEFALSVDLTWQQGITFDVDLQ